MEELKIKKLLTLVELWEYGVKATPEDELRKFYNGIDNPMLLVDELSDKSNIALKDLVEIPSGADVEFTDFEGCFICLNPNTYHAMHLYGIDDQNMEVENLNSLTDGKVSPEAFTRLLFEFDKKEIDEWLLGSTHYKSETELEQEAMQFVNSKRVYKIDNI